MPVGLWNDGYLVAFGFQKSADNGGAERWMINVGIARKENHI